MCSWRSCMDSVRFCIYVSRQLQTVGQFINLKLQDYMFRVLSIENEVIVYPGLRERWENVRDGSAHKPDVMACCVTIDSCDFNHSSQPRRLILRLATSSLMWKPPFLVAFIAFSKVLSTGGTLEAPPFP
ncbi:hypothetical protein L208DRAFT_61253 [Tricholoma matsutake]|nr:hypothetical protein L208DRAFT_61253 [Tricholoma matsutake 945]